RTSYPLDHSFTILGMHRLAPAQRVLVQCLAISPPDPFVGRAHVEELNRLARPAPIYYLNIFSELTKSQFAFPERSLSFQLIGNINGYPGDANRFARRISDRKTPQRNPFHDTVITNNPKNER